MMGVETLITGGSQSSSNIFYRLMKSEAFKLKQTSLSADFKCSYNLKVTQSCLLETVSVNRSVDTDNISWHENLVYGCVSALKDR